MSARFLAPFDVARLPVVETDVLVVGTGIAGLYTALKARSAGRVVLLTKRRLADSNTEFAQGGIAAAIGSEDSPRLHMADTFVAGADLCDPDAVKVLVQEGPRCVLELVSLGTQFDMLGSDFALTREGAHGRPRILHARGDATGDEIRRALQDRVEAEGIEVLENHYVVDLMTYGGRCWGVLTRAESGQLMAFLARATVLCSGGAGQVFSRSTNPEVATGDGIAMGFRAGAEVQDLEFIQFHPTALAAEGSPKFLISEAMRGEGATLLNCHNRQFMNDYHEQAELAPRDIVARAIVAEMRHTGEPHVYLDASRISEVYKRFPTIYAECLRRGLDLRRDRIPVAPAAHYTMGGLRTDTWGRTTLPGLYACGEVACTGIHGANRLASNSLLEGLVFGGRIARHLRRVLRREPAVPAAVRTMRWSPTAVATPDSAITHRWWQEVQDVMWEHVGILRSGPELLTAIARLEELERRLLPLDLDSQPQAETLIRELQLRNLVTAASLIARSAWVRDESRGAHFRTDFPQSDDAQWKRRIVQLRGGALVFAEVSSSAAGGAVRVRSELRLRALREGTDGS